MTNLAKAYMALTKIMLEARAANSEDEDRLLDLMDAMWPMLRGGEIAEINKAVKELNLSSS